MPEWDKVERRKNYPERCFNGVSISLEEIKLQLVKIDSTILLTAKQYADDYKRHQESLEKHEQTIYGNGKEGMTTKVTKVIDTMDSHIISDRWMFGTVITLLLALITRTFMR